MRLPGRLSPACGAVTTPLSGTWSRPSRHTGAPGLRILLAPTTSLGTIEYPDLPHQPNRTSLGYEQYDLRLRCLASSPVGALACCSAWCPSSASRPVFLVSGSLVNKSVSKYRI